jgi:hypothetical protein
MYVARLSRDIEISEFAEPLSVDAVSISTASCIPIPTE